MPAAKSAAVYVRVSTARQDTRSQLPDLDRWEDAQDGPVERYEDKAGGTSMDRPGWRRLEADIRAGKVGTLVVWRLDRLGRTAAGLTALFEELRTRGVNLVSLRDGLDFSTPAGRLMANVLASVAQFETEVRGERVQAGMAAAKAKGKRIGGSKKGVRRKVTPAKERTVQRLRRDGLSVAAIAREVGVSRPTVDKVLREAAAA